MFVSVWCGPSGHVYRVPPRAVAPGAGVPITVAMANAGLGAEANKKKEIPSKYFRILVKRVAKVRVEIL